jgi:hypothetical protein
VKLPGPNESHSYAIEISSFEIKDLSPENESQQKPNSTAVILAIANFLLVAPYQAVAFTPPPMGIF